MHSPTPGAKPKRHAMTLQRPSTQRAPPRATPRSVEQLVSASQAPSKTHSSPFWLPGTPCTPYRHPPHDSGCQRTLTRLTQLGARVDALPPVRVGHSARGHGRRAQARKRHLRAAVPRARHGAGVPRPGLGGAVARLEVRGRRAVALPPLLRRPEGLQRGPPLLAGGEAVGGRLADLPRRREAALEHPGRGRDREGVRLRRAGAVDAACVSGEARGLPVTMWAALMPSRTELQRQAGSQSAEVRA
jgi:hypothetical protein